MLNQEIDSRKFIMIVGIGTLPKAIKAVIKFIFEGWNPHIQRVEPNKYPKIRAAVVPDLVIVTDFELATDIVAASNPEFFVVCCADHEREQAESLNGVAAIAKPIGAFDELCETIAELLYK